MVDVSSVGVFFAAFGNTAKENVFDPGICCCLQELSCSVSDIVEGILKMHDTTKVRRDSSDGSRILRWLSGRPQPAARVSVSIFYHKIPKRPPQPNKP